jgi:hypothetical protein
MIHCEVSVQNINIMLRLHHTRTRVSVIEATHHANNILLSSNTLSSQVAPVHTMSNTSVIFAIPHVLVHLTTKANDLSRQRTTFYVNPSHHHSVYLTNLPSPWIHLCPYPRTNIFVLHCEQLSKWRFVEDDKNIVSTTWDQK